MCRPHAGGELAGALSFLMQLGFRQVGRPYPLEGLGPQEQRIAAHMAQLGLLATYIAVSPGSGWMQVQQPCRQPRQP
jgi:transcription initiation factor TFIIH subunit 4